MISLSKNWFCYFSQGCQKTWNLIKFEKNLEFLTCSVVKFRNFGLTQKIYYIDDFSCHYQTFFILKNIFTVALEYLFNVFILFNTASYLKLNFKLKIEPKMYTFKNLEKIWKTWKHF